MHDWGHPKTSPLSSLALLCAGTTWWAWGPATAQGNFVLCAALLAAWERWGCLKQSRAEGTGINSVTCASLPGAGAGR